MKVVVFDEQGLIDLGHKIGSFLKGGEIIELIGDVGAGKTTLTKGIAKGVGISDEVTSPSFTISRTYEGDKLYLYHYDFYRLDDPGIMSADLTESSGQSDAVVIVEWSDIVKSTLSQKRIQINIFPIDEGRELSFRGLERFPYIQEGLMV